MKKQSVKDINKVEAVDPPADNGAAASIPLDPQVKVKNTNRRRTFSKAFKLKFLAAYDACSNSEARGALLRKEGLYHSRLSVWRKDRDEGKLGKAAVKKSKAGSPRLERENAQLKKQLGHAQAVIELQKKVSELFGQHILLHEMSVIS